MCAQAHRLPHHTRVRSAPAATGAAPPPTASSPPRPAAPAPAHACVVRPAPCAHLNRPDTRCVPKPWTANSANRMPMEMPTTCMRQESGGDGEWGDGALRRIEHEAVPRMPTEMPTTFEEGWLVGRGGAAALLLPCLLAAQARSLPARPAQQQQRAGLPASPPRWRWHNRPPRPPPAAAHLTTLRTALHPALSAHPGLTAALEMPTWNWMPSTADTCRLGRDEDRTSRRCGSRSCQQPCRLGGSAGTGCPPPPARAGAAQIDEQVDRASAGLGGAGAQARS